MKKSCNISLQPSKSKVKTKDFNRIQIRLRASLSQNSQKFMYVTFFALTFTKMKFIFTNTNIRLSTKINTLKAYIIVHPYAWIWMLNTDRSPERRLEATEMCYIRRVMRISWPGTKDPYAKPSEKKTTTIVWAYKQSWWIRQIVSEKIWGTKSRRRQRTK